MHIFQHIEKFVGMINLVIILLASSIHGHAILSPLICFYSFSITFKILFFKKSKYNVFLVVQVMWKMVLDIIRLTCYTFMLISKFVVASKSIYKSKNFNM